jgi:hypothetical protein
MLAFYKRLLPMLAQPEFKWGRWHLAVVTPSNDCNPTWRNILAHFITPVPGMHRLLMRAPVAVTSPGASGTSNAGKSQAVGEAAAAQPVATVQPVDANTAAACTSWAAPAPTLTGACSSNNGSMCTAPAAAEVRLGLEQRGGEAEATVVAASTGLAPVTDRPTVSTAAAATGATISLLSLLTGKTCKEADTGGAPSSIVSTSSGASGRTTVLHTANSSTASACSTVSADTLGHHSSAASNGTAASGRSGSSGSSGATATSTATITSSATSGSGVAPEFLGIRAAVAAATAPVVVTIPGGGPADSEAGPSPGAEDFGLALAQALTTGMAVAGVAAPVAAALPVPAATGAQVAHAEEPKLVSAASVLSEPALLPVTAPADLAASSAAAGTQTAAAVGVPNGVPHATPEAVEETPATLADLDPASTAPAAGRTFLVVVNYSGAIASGHVLLCRGDDTSVKSAECAASAAHVASLIRPALQPSGILGTRVTAQPAAIAGGGAAQGTGRAAALAPAPATATVPALAPASGCTRIALFDHLTGQVTEHALRDIAPVGGVWLQLQPWQCMLLEVMQVADE